MKAFVVEKVGDNEFKSSIQDIETPKCEKNEVAFFFKQWGGWGADGKKRAKKQNGRELNGRTWDAMPTIQQLI